MGGARISAVSSEAASGCEAASVLNNSSTAKMRAPGFAFPKLFNSYYFPSADGATSEASSDSGSPVAVFPASAAAAGRVFVLIAGFVVGAFAPSADFSLHWPAVVPSAGGPAPVSVGVSGAPVAASRTAFPAVVGISGPVSGFPCLGE